MSRLTFSVNWPCPDTRRSLVTAMNCCVGWSVMMLMTPAMASLPYSDEAAPSSTSMRFTLAMLMRDKSTLLEMSPDSF